jgi:branched-chain amino acid aminotransferase
MSATTLEPTPAALPAGDPDFSQGVAYVDGQYVPILEARIPMLDWGFTRSDACQDTVSVWGGLFFRLEDHLQRFERSYSRLRMQCPLSRDAVREVLFGLVRRSGLREAYVQMIMTRGRPPTGSRDPRQSVNRFQAYCIPYVWIARPEVQERGLHLHLSSRVRVPGVSVDPEVKHYHWLDFNMGLFDAYDRGAETVCLVDLEGNVAEGPGFNIFAVTGGRVRTPQRHVLDGMTRDTVQQLCAEQGAPFERVSLSPQMLREADEVFLSSTSGGVIPVSRLDGVAVGAGMPGALTLRLREAYWRKRAEGWLGTPAFED